MLLASTAAGQHDNERAPSDPSLKLTHEAVMVTVDGDDLYAVVGISGFDAQERADDIAARVIAVAEGDHPAAQVHILDGEFGPQVIIGGKIIDTVLDLDVELEGMDAYALAEVRGIIIQREIAEYRARRTEASIEESWLAAIGWTAVFVVFCLLLVVIHRFLIRRGNRKVEEWVRKVEATTGRLAEANVVVSVIRLTGWIIVFALFLIALYYYLSQALFSFPATRSFASVLLNNFTDPVLDMAVAAVGEIPDLIVLAGIFFLARYVLKNVRLVFVNIEVGTIKISGFDVAWTWPTYRIIRVVVVIFAMVFAYPYVPGSGTAAFQGISIFLGIVLSLGSSSIISNLLAGLFVIYRRGVSLGDLINVGGQIGKVESMLVLETLLRTPHNELVSIPNSQLLGANLINYSKPGNTPGVIVTTRAGIGYEEPHAKIETLLLEAVARTDDLKATPAPFVLRSKLADFAVFYEVNAFPTTVDALPQTKSDLNANILDVFNERRVQIMTPSYMADPSEPKIAPIKKSEAVSPLSR